MIIATSYHHVINTSRWIYRRLVHEFLGAKRRGSSKYGLFLPFFVVNHRPWASLSLQNGQSDLLKESSGMSFVNFGVILKEKSL